jgi:hypothetical protein
MKIWRALWRAERAVMDWAEDHPGLALLSIAVFLVVVSVIVDTIIRSLI